MFSYRLSKVKCETYGEANQRSDNICTYNSKKKKAYTIVVRF